jgi:hypothetical protein
MTLIDDRLPHWPEIVDADGIALILTPRFSFPRGGQKRERGAQHG